MRFLNLITLSVLFLQLELKTDEKFEMQWNSLMVDLQTLKKCGKFKNKNKYKCNHSILSSLSLRVLFWLIGVPPIELESNG